MVGAAVHTEQHVASSALSDLVIEGFGTDVGWHACSAIGVSGVQLGFAMEIESEVQLRN